jgi:DNA-directed RNA polymerase subunit M/transcription elongation factor TFIIS
MKSKLIDDNEIKGKFQCPNCGCEKMISNEKVWQTYQVETFSLLDNQILIDESELEQTDDCLDDDNYFCCSECLLEITPNNILDCIKKG